MTTDHNSVMLRTDNEAARSYIWQEPKVNDSIALRNNNPATKRFGLILLHTIMAATLIFGSQEQQQSVVTLVGINHNNK